MSITEVNINRVKKKTKSSWERKSEELLKENEQSAPLIATTVTYLYGGGIFGARGYERIMSFSRPLKEGDYYTAAKAKTDFFRLHGTTDRNSTQDLSNEHNIVADESISQEEIERIRRLGGKIYLSLIEAGTTNSAVAGLPLFFYFISNAIVRYNV